MKVNDFDEIRLLELPYFQIIMNLLCEMEDIMKDGQGLHLPFLVEGRRTRFLLFFLYHHSLYQIFNNLNYPL